MTPEELEILLLKSRQGGNSMTIFEEICRHLNIPSGTTEEPKNEEQEVTNG